MEINSRPNCKTRHVCRMWNFNPEMETGTHFGKTWTHFGNLGHQLENLVLTVPMKNEFLDI